MVRIVVASGVVAVYDFSVGREQRLPEGQGAMAGTERRSAFSMMVCHCNRLTDDVLRDAAADLALEPGRSVVTPGAVFRVAGCRPRCGGCFPLVVEVLHGATRGLPTVLDPNERPAAAHAHACADCPRAEHERSRTAVQMPASPAQAVPLPAMPLPTLPLPAVALPTMLRPAPLALHGPLPAVAAALGRAG